MPDLARALRNDRNLYIGGGLGKHRVPGLATWVCIANHTCLETLKAPAGDRMCYVLEKVAGLPSYSRMHPYGLNSELNLCTK